MYTCWEDTASLSISFSITDVETDPSTLIVSSESSAISLVSNENMMFTGTGSSRAIVLTPTTNGYGQTIITISLTDSSLTTSTSFTLSVTPINDSPEISGLDVSYTTSEDTPLPALSFRINDVDNAPSTLNVSATSSSITLVTEENLTFTGTEISRGIQITSTDNVYGQTTITISVSDDQLTVTHSFILSITSVNDIPEISGLNAAYTISEDTASGPLSFTISDIENDPQDLIVTANSSSQTLISIDNIILSGTGNARNISITPNQDLYGSSMISISVSDGALTQTQSFTLFVNSVNDAPEISGFNTIYYTNEDTSIGPLGFTVTDADHDSESLMISSESSSTTMVSNENITTSGTASSRWITITPTSNMFGSTTISISLTDGDLTTTTAFTLSITPVNDMPVMSELDSSYTTNEDTAIGPINLTVTDVDNEAENLVLTLQSSNSILIDPDSIPIVIAGNTRTLTLSPTTHQSGSSMLTLALTDGALTSTQSFRLTVISVNDPPDITGLSDYYAVRKNRSIGPVAFTITDVDNDDSSLSVTSESSCTTIVAAENMVISGTSTSRSFSITPITDMHGRTTISISASDGSLTTTASFVLAVTRDSSTPEIDVQYSHYYTYEDTAIESINFTIFDADDDIGYLVVSAESSSSTLVVDQNIKMIGTGYSRTLSITPTQDLYGETLITLAVTDDNSSLPALP